MSSTARSVARLATAHTARSFPTALQLDEESRSCALRRVKMADDNKTEYQHVSENEADAEAVSDNLQTEPPRNAAQTPTNRPWIQTILLQALIVLWVVPIGVLLWLNFTEWTIGASAWCPRGDCYRSVRTDYQVRGCGIPLTSH